MRRKKNAYRCISLKEFWSSKTKPLQAKSIQKISESISHCWICNTEGNWMEYPTSSLYDDNFYRWADKQHKYLERDFSSIRLMNVTRAGTRFWRRFPNQETHLILKRQANHSEVHTSHVDYYTELLYKLEKIDTAIFKNGNLPEWLTLADLKYFRWEKEKRLTIYGIQPDIYGSYPKQRIFNHIANHHNQPKGAKIVCIEIMDKGPPSDEKLSKLLKFSKETKALIILGMVTNFDPSKNGIYFRASERHKSMSAAYYIFNGIVYKNGEPAWWLNNAEKLRKELVACQNKSGYNPTYL